VKQGEIFDKATLNSLLASSLPRYLDFIDARAENPVSHKYVVANWTNIQRLRDDLQNMSLVVDILIFIQFKSSLDVIKYMLMTLNNSALRHYIPMQCIYKIVYITNRNPLVQSIFNTELPS